MARSSFERDLSAFLDFFGDIEAVERGKGVTVAEQVDDYLADCPKGAIAVLLVAAAPYGKSVIQELADEEGVSERGCQATGLLAELRPLLDALKSQQKERAEHVQAASEPELTISVKPVFDPAAKHVIVNWRVRLDGRWVYEANDEPVDLLRVFVRVAAATADGWEQMKGMGWSLGREHVRDYQLLLQDAAEMVKRLSGLLPACESRESDDGSE